MEVRDRDRFHGAASYADTHARKNPHKIGEDQVLGPVWRDLMKSIRNLLIGDIGKLDAGICDSLICAMLRAEGFNPDL